MKRWLVEIDFGDGGSYRLHLKAETEWQAIVNVMTHHVGGREDVANITVEES